MIQRILPLFTRKPDVCDGCQNEYPPGSLSVHVIHFGRHTMQFHECCQECREQVFHDWRMKMLREAGL